MKLLLSLAYRNLFRNPGRTLSVVAAYVAGLAGAIVFFAFIYRLQMGLSAATIYLESKGHVSILKKDSRARFYSDPKKYGLSVAEVQSIRDALQENASWIQAIKPVLLGGGLLSNGERQKPFFAFAIPGEDLQFNWKHPLVLNWATDWTPKVFDLKKWEETPKAMSLTGTLHSKLATQTVGTLQALAIDYEGGLNGVDVIPAFTHFGRSSFTEEISVIMQMQNLQNLLNTDKIFYLGVYLEKFDQLEMRREQIIKSLKQTNLDLEVFAFNDEKWAPYSVGTLNFMYFIGIFVGSMLICAVLFAIANIITLILMERRTEFGTMMSLGFTQKLVLLMLSLESLILSFFCSLFGCVLAHVLQLSINGLKVLFVPPGSLTPVHFRVVINWAWALELSVVFLVCSWLVTFFVAYRKLRIKPIDLLR